uniref:hypothetical protein n=1 Tax=Escherichia coli TaxID=562 RepID=UPI001CCB543D
SEYTATDEFLIKQGTTAISYTVAKETDANLKDNVINLTFTSKVASNVTVATNPSKLTLTDLTGNVLEAIKSPITAQ